MHTSSEHQPHLRDLRGNPLYRELPRLEWTRIRPLWQADRYDGPISGYLLYDGVPHWFEWVTGEAAQQNEDAGLTRQYLAAHLTPEQFGAAAQWHAMYREQVAKNFDFDEEGLIPNPGLVGPREEWEAFIEKHPHVAGERDEAYLDNAVTGWFEWGS